MNYKKEIDKAIEKKSFKRERIYKHKIHLFISDVELNKINEDVKNLGTDKSKLVRKLINKDFVYSNLYSKLLNEFRKQGNNLNQIARTANSNNTIEIKELKTIERTYKQILEEVRKLK